MPFSASDKSEKFALISDIHGNLAALEAVLADIEKVGAREVWCLGDVVGYGPQPLECVRLVKERCSVFMLGNHENALTPGNAEKFNLRARRAIEWTRTVIEKDPEGREWLERLSTRPRFHEQDDLLFVHGSPADPTEEYLFPKDSKNGPKLKKQFDIIRRVAFCGHTHFPGVFEEGRAFCPPEEMMVSGIYMLDYRVKAIINVGSVGQPRDHNPKACYATFDGDSVVYRRVAYDVKATAKRIYTIPELDDSLGDRILEGR